MTWWKRSPYSPVSIGSKTGRSSVEASVTAVLDLPGVVQHVPGHPAQDISRRPLAGLAAPERVRDHCALLLPRRPWGHPGAGFGRIASLRLHDVPAYVVTVATAPARPFAQLRRRTRYDLVEGVPDALEQVQLPVELGVVERLQVPLGWHRRRAEVGGRVAGHPAEDRRCLDGQRRPDGGCVAVGVRQQLLDGGLVTLSAAAPAGPVQRTGERPLLPAFEVDPHHSLIVAGRPPPST